MLRNGAWLRPGAEATSAVPPQSGPASLGQLDSAARPRPSHTDAQPRGVQVTVPGTMPGRCPQLQGPHPRMLRAGRARDARSSRTGSAGVCGDLGGEGPGSLGALRAPPTEPGGAWAGSSLDGEGLGPWVGPGREGEGRGGETSALCSASCSGREVGTGWAGSWTSGHWDGTGRVSRPHAANRCGPCWSARRREGSSGGRTVCTAPFPAAVPHPFPGWQVLAGGQGDLEGQLRGHGLGRAPLCPPWGQGTEPNSRASRPCWTL